MGYWEPIATPGSHMEPPDPEAWFCEVCEEDEEAYCTCGRCEACGERGNVSKYRVEDDEAWLCAACQVI